MKAILVVDVDEKYIGAIGTEIQFINQKYNCKWKLKPMPSFKAVDLNDTRDVMMFCHGWNTCLEEINATENDINAKNAALKGETE